MRRASAFFRRTLALVGLGVLVAPGCYKSTDGPNPDDTAPYFPVGIGLSGSKNFLFLANSNFDLRDNSGTLQAYRLHAIGTEKGQRGIIDKALECRKGLGEWRIRAEKQANEGIPIEAAPLCREGTEPSPDPEHHVPPPQAAVWFAAAGVRIGAFAADLKVIPRAGFDPKNSGRLLVPVRGDASITVVDFDESDKGGITLNCAPGAVEGGFGGKCSAANHLTGAEGFGGQGSRGIVLEGEPFAVATATDVKVPPTSGKITGLAAVAHQSSGDVSLFIDTETTVAGAPGAKLAYTLTGLPTGATAIARWDDGVTDAVRFLVANRSAPTLSIVQLFTDPKSDRSGLVLTGSVPLSPQNQGYDSRGIAVDPPNPGETRPTRVFLTNRTPASIVVGQNDEHGTLTFFDNIAMPVGASRIERAVIDGRTVLLAVSFDARSLVVVDPETHRARDVVLTQHGPYAIALYNDEKNDADGTPGKDEAAHEHLAFIANFTDSTIQVIDLNVAHTESLIYTVGAPSAPRN